MPTPLSLQEVTGNEMRSDARSQENLAVGAPDIVKEEGFWTDRTDAQEKANGGAEPAAPSSCYAPRGPWVHAAKELAIPEPVTEVRRVRATRPRASFILDRRFEVKYMIPRDNTRQEVSSWYLSLRS